MVITSDKCYENREQNSGYREDDAMGGHDPYSASKGAAELLAASYRRSFFDPHRLSDHGVKLATARAGNVIGGGDWAKDRIVTDLVRHLVGNRPVPIRNPRAVRPWQHVLEPLSGYLALGAKMLGSNDPAWCSGWNFGPSLDCDDSVGNLAEKFCRAWEGGSWVDTSNTGQPHEAAVLRLNVDKAVTRLGWRGQWGLDKTIARTARWYREFYRAGGACMRDTCLDEIDAYTGNLKQKNDAGSDHARQPLHSEKAA